MQIKAVLTIPYSCQGHAGSNIAAGGTHKCMKDRQISLTNTKNILHTILTVKYV